MICCAYLISGYVATMDWQQFVALMIVATAAWLLAWGKFRPRRFSFGRNGHCGCAGVSPSACNSSIVFHTRKGERPRVVIKMR
jgi:hypothetical protein